MKKILVCTQLRSAGSNCAAKHSGLLPDMLRDAFGEIKCFSRCNEGPNVKLHPDGKFWSHVDANTIPEIIQFIKNS
jgi:NADH:ubiquinone oxidoreductase subunit E